MRFSALMVSGLVTAATLLPREALALNILKKVLVLNFNGVGGFPHTDGWREGGNLIKQIGTEEGFEVKIIEDNQKSTFNEASLTGVNVLVMNSVTNPNAMPTNQKDAIKKYLYGGGSIMGIHATPDPNPIDWMVNEVIFWKYDEHPGIQVAKIYVDKDVKAKRPDHPILKGLDQFFDANNEFPLEDEWFKIKAGSNPRDKAPGVTILLSLDENSYDCGCVKTLDHPMAFINEGIGTGKGKFFMALTGHDAKVHAYRDKGLKILWKNALLYLGGETSGTTPISKGKEVTEGKRWWYENSTGLLRIDHNQPYDVTISNIKGKQIASFHGSKPQTFQVSKIHEAGIYLISIKTLGKTEITHFQVIK